MWHSKEKIMYDPVFFSTSLPRIIFISCSKLYGFPARDDTRGRLYLKINFFFSRIKKKMRISWKANFPYQLKALISFRYVSSSQLFYVGPFDSEQSFLSFYYSRVSPETQFAFLSTEIIICWHSFCSFPSFIAFFDCDKSSFQPSATGSEDKSQQGRRSVSLVACATVHGSLLVNN